MCGLSYKNCRLCPRECGADRANGEVGFCGMGDDPVLGLAALHYWEEPCISGEKGTGAVFFSGCNLGCPYCQNQKLTREKFGAQIDAERLRQIFFELIDKGATSIDLVNPTHFLPSVIEALSTPLPVPVIYNCGGYEKAETIKYLEGKIDIYLPDFKYADENLAQELSGIDNYADNAKAAIKEMFRQTGNYRLSAKGLLQKGVLIRHLILPGQLDNTFDVIDWLVENFPPGAVLFSLMGQYMPAGDLSRFPWLQRKLTAEEYKRAQDYLLALGWDDGYLQELSSSSDEFLPDFDLSGVLHL